MNSHKKEDTNNIFFQNKKSPTNKSLLSLRKLTRVKSVHVIKENNWKDGFNKNKLPEYNSANDNKNFHINLSIKSYSGHKNINDLKKFKSEDSLNTFSPKNSFTNGKYFIKTASAKMRNINYNNDNLKYINMINENNINTLWDELCVSKSYRNLFCVIYKELNDKDKQEIYSREINELTSIKNDINILKSNIDLRINTIKDISGLNDKLNAEIINTNNYKNESIINEISKKIEILREYTINICQIMKKIKYELNGIKNLDKYDIDIISEKFNFDKNYVIKMKSELNFLKEGYAKYYFNINNDQSPFLLNASEKNESNNNETLIHIIPLQEEKKYDIMECIFYIYQELIAYQNEKVNQNILRRISPLKKIEANENNNLKITNGKEENNKFNNANNYILRKSSSAINNLAIKENDKEKNKILNISQNFVYSKKKFLKINKNGNNLLLNQFRSQRNSRNENKNSSIGLRYNNPLVIQNNFPRKSEIIKKKNSISNNIIGKEKNINEFFSEDDKISEK